MSEEGELVTLYVYDLSNGLASQFGQQLTGRPIEGIWHTALVLYGMEVFYGQGIDIKSPPESTHHGRAVKKLNMGRTLLDKATFLEYIENMRAVYSADKYHLLDFNCNTFSNDVLGFLNGNSIPDEIINLPRDILATPFGRSMRPMIDNMFSGRNSPSTPPEVQTFSPGPSTESVGSNYQISTSVSSLASILHNSKAVAIMFTSSGCPPCQVIKPLFNELASTHGKKDARIEFVLVEMGVGNGNEVASKVEFGGPIRATPTFCFFLKGVKVGECRGADAGELKSQVGMLSMQAYPPHPHSRLTLQELIKLTKSLAPVTYPTLPNLTSLATKLKSFLTDAAMTSSNIPSTTSLILTQTVVQFLQQPATSKVPIRLPQQWTSATLNALDNLPHQEWFPILDLWRVGIILHPVELNSSFSTLLPKLLTEKYILKELKQGEESCKPLLITSIKLLSNALAIPSLAKELLNGTTLRPHLTSLVIKALLDHDKSVRSAGAGLIWSIIGRFWSQRVRGTSSTSTSSQVDEEWETEIGSAVLEALGRETESQEVIHRLTASLGLLLYESNHFELLDSLFQVLGARSILREKETIVSEKKEVVALLREVQEMCSGGE